MDALRLIKTARHALAEARSVPDVLQEAWQAALLTEALAGRLGEHQAGEVAALAHLLAEAGGHAGSCLEVSADRPEQADWPATGRAARLSEVGDPELVLGQLRLLLNEASEALIIVACGAETESVYWQCIDGVDANAECRDLVVELLGVLRRLEPDPEGRERLGPWEDGPPKASALLLPLDPPTASRRRRYRAVEPASAGVSQESGPLPARPPEDCRAASMPARSAFTEASSSCNCSSSPLGAAPAVANGSGVPECCLCGAAGASYLGSDMRGPLQLGSAT